MESPDALTTDVEVEIAMEAAFPATAGRAKTKLACRGKSAVTRLRSCMSAYDILRRL